MLPQHESRTITKQRYSAFTKRAAQMKRSRESDLAAVKRRSKQAVYEEMKHTPSTTSGRALFTHYTDPNAAPEDQHNFKRRKISLTTFIQVFKDEANLSSEMGSVFEAYAKLSIKCHTRANPAARSNVCKTWHSAGAEPDYFSLKAMVSMMASKTAAGRPEVRCEHDNFFFRRTQKLRREYKRDAEKLAAMFSETRDDSVSAWSELD
ncbi:hypothetical protein E4T38_03116 [Aureobasidium subglaciale]|nr:hypothetical protein E4T38_03116 [Aureobasidium subglaciale]KAI5226893.1 hypothetical protein E4T40_02890 [Aureobasidium subglaciale]KAI5230205.1 hypothetical protein E4T41_03113 [Aureobasidium subglaciale]KAI5264608.1 hypothetical protein E4T46_02891 [Aureobasidium subglaciale]